MFEKEDLDKWFNPKYYKDYSKHNFNYDPNIKQPDHPMCRCSMIIRLKHTQFIPCSKYLCWVYARECKDILIWRN